MKMRHFKELRLSIASYEHEGANAQGVPVGNVYVDLILDNGEYDSMGIKNVVWIDKNVDRPDLDEDWWQSFSVGGFVGIVDGQPCPLVVRGSTERPLEVLFRDRDGNLSPYSGPIANADHEAFMQSDEGAVYRAVPVA